MTEKYQNKYRIKSARLPDWDYGWNGYYFVTICTQGHTPWFGRVVDGEMVLSDVGEIVQEAWLRTSDMRPDMKLNVDVFVIMPNHFHAVVVIGENAYNTCRRRDALQCVSTGKSMNQFGPQSKNLASIIRGFKAAVTKRSRRIHPDFTWQPRFHDHVVRNEDSHRRIAEYIQCNPAKWMDDSFYVK